MRLPARILVVGSGGREHALVKACLASPAHPRVIAAPGNGGIALDVPCFSVAVEDIAGLVAQAANASSMKANPIALTAEELTQTLRQAL